MTIYRNTIRLLLLIIFLSPSVGLGKDTGAETSDLDAESAAKLAFKNGTDLYNEGKYEEAVGQFRNAYDMHPSWKLWYNIGQAESASKRFGRALIAFELYVVEGGDDIPEQRLTEVLTEIQRLHVLVGSVAIIAPDGAEVYVDGDRHGVAPLAGDIKLATGNPHEIKIIFDGEILKTQQVRVSGGDRLTVSAEQTVVEQTNDESTMAVVTDADETELPAASDEGATPKDNTAVSPASVDATSPTAHRSQRPLKITGWSLLGTGVATAVTGGLFGIEAFSRAEDLPVLCTSNKICETEEAQSTRDSSERFGNVSTVLISVGTAMAAAGIITLVVARAKSERATTATRKLQLTPTATGAVLTGSF